MRGIREKCLFCEFWEPLAGARDCTKGHCHERPPVFETDITDVFPLTRMSDWCGKFRLFQHPEIKVMADLVSSQRNRDFRNDWYTSQGVALDHPIHELDRYMI